MSILTKEDRQRLLKLRDGFRGELKDGGVAQSLWTDVKDLELYDRSFAQRVSWKWKKALGNFLQKYDVVEENFSLMDWGCGSGVASTTFASVIEQAREVLYWDHSEFAMEFCLAHKDSIWNKQSRASGEYEKADVLLLSHVLNELSTGQLRSLECGAVRYRSIVVVEAGSPSSSNNLVKFREKILELGFEILAPCPHSGPCPLGGEVNEKLWCHFFCEPPSEVHQDPFWAAIKKEIEIDIRRQSFSFFIAQDPKRPLFEKKSNWQKTILGLPRLHKAGYMVDFCESEGIVSERNLLAKKNLTREELKSLKLADLVFVD